MDFAGPSCCREFPGISSRQWADRTPISTQEKMLEHSPTLVDRLTSRLKNNPVTAVLIMVGLVVIALAGFTDALKKLIHVIPAFYQANVSGDWRSDFLTDPVIKADFQYIFSLKADRDILYGTARRLVPSCLGHEDSGICKNHDKPAAVVDGRINGKEISFSCNWRLPSSEPWKWVQMRESFHGRINGDEIRFIRQDGSNAPAAEFLCRRFAPAGDEPEKQNGTATTTRHNNK